MSDDKRSAREVADTLERLRREISRQRGGSEADAPKADPRRVLVTPPPGSATPSEADEAGSTDSTGMQATGAGAGSPGKADSVPLTDEPKRSASGIHRPAAGGLSSKRVQVADASRTHEVVDELLRHRRRRRGRVVGIAGLPRHGKTTLADRLRERAAERPGADLRYNKTERGDVNVYYIPGRREHHALIDMAGEDYQALGSYERELPQLMEAFLWPVLQRLDGLVLLMALPIVWSGWNDDDREERCTPAEDERREMAAATERMLDAHRMLLKYAVVARNLRRLKRRIPSLGLDRETPPSRDQVDDAFQQAPKYDRPVSLVLSKADLYVGKNRSCLYTPNLPRLQHRAPLGIRPGQSDPLLVAAGHFPDFLDFLARYVRHFKWSFCQALQDRSPYPDPLEARAEGADVSSLIGGEGILDFVTRHPWGVPGVSAATALRLDRRLRRNAWDAAMMGAGSD